MIFASHLKTTGVWIISSTISAESGAYKESIYEETVEYLIFTFSGTLDGVFVI
jgi:hypothetical protein